MRRADHQTWIDVACTIVCRGSLRGLLRSARARAQACGWTIEAMAVTDLHGEPLDADRDWPEETLGSLIYDAQPARHSLFWSSVAVGGVTRVAAGIYVGEFAGERGGDADPCARALDDLMRLFGGPETLCVALALEDDPEIDVGPGIVGCYRTSLWRALGIVERAGLTARQRGADWLEVRAARMDALAVQLAVTRWLERSQEPRTADSQAVFAELAADLVSECRHTRLLLRLLSCPAGEWHDLGELGGDEPQVAAAIAAVGGPILASWQPLPLSLHGDGYCTIALYSEAEHLHSLALYNQRLLQTLRLV